MSEKTTLTPPQLARKWGVHPAKILALISTGQLRAWNCAVDPKGGPRWRIGLDEVERFIQSRTKQPPPPKQRRRRRKAVTNAVEYF